MKKNGLFIAATGQNIGKTTICLGLISGLLKRIKSVGFIKPVGQEHILVDQIKVDKDVALFKEHFGIDSAISHMSPVIFDKHFTRNYLDNKISHKALMQNILQSYQTLEKEFSMMACEGTGHVGVGSIAQINNADVCKALGLECVLIGEGGLGSSFDTLTLNKELLEKKGVFIKGIILNKVLPEKLEMVKEYMQKALQRWNIPLLGLIPYNRLLSTPTMNDFAHLFQTSLLSGSKFRFFHFKKTILVACSDIRFDQLIEKEQMIITPASREDIILTTLSHYWDSKVGEEMIHVGMILTGTVKPSDTVIEQLKAAQIPAIYVPEASYTVMRKIMRHTAKIQRGDREKVEQAKQLVEKHLNFDLILK